MVGGFPCPVLIYQSNANLDVTILFGKITLDFDSKFRKIVVGDLYRDKDPHSILVQFFIRY